MFLLIAKVLVFVSFYKWSFLFVSGLMWVFCSDDFACLSFFLIIIKILLYAQVWHIYMINLSA